MIDLDLEEKSVVFEPGVHTFTLNELLRKALKYKGLTLAEDAICGCSENFREYVLDDELLKTLATSGIRWRAQPATSTCDYCLLVGDRATTEQGDWWGFHRDPVTLTFDMRMSLYVYFPSLNYQQRGLCLLPRVSGPGVCSGHRWSNLRLFQALTENDPAATPIAKELAASDEDGIVISWTELGLGGLRTMRDLFAEFVGSNEVVKKVEHTIGIFQPCPYPPRQEPGEEVFMVETAQPALFRLWGRQRDDFQRRFSA